MVVISLRNEWDRYIWNEVKYNAIDEDWKKEKKKEKKKKDTEACDAAP